MKFETSFNIGDHAWCMKENKPVEVVISAIEIFFVNTNQDRIKYNAKNAVRGLRECHSIAIVEWPDGTIDNVPVEHVRFLKEEI